MTKEEIIFAKKIEWILKYSNNKEHKYVLETYIAVSHSNSTKDKMVTKIVDSYPDSIIDSLPNE